MLEIEGIHTYYGLSHILFDVSLNVQRGQVVCLLGRNGAGKSTTLRTIMGLAPPRRGSITFKGEEIAGKEPYELARKGMGYVPDDRRIFADLTVEENLEIAARKTTTDEGWDQDGVYQLFPALGDMTARKAGCLSGGEQKMLAIARALMGNPELLLLDEPTEGLAPLLVRALEERILELKRSGLTVLLAEQNVRSALRLSDFGYIIDDGHIRYQGTVEELRDHEEVRSRYLLV
ncbi:MAG: ATP-binding cassette domain-containing protein [Anaerolineae bacterium]|nr:ATP-binding cassette domain-containing protein [Anaerolineae bacterium]NIN97396.1 ATP-binding cassette domain-containing protein [Anaerolineae bacterium]NIQ80325.1 ATP-binding cassette domain-containing protein [Anaerolineae bacterium]